jgi:hypothetical protein
MYNGIMMRSRLEATFAARLDREGRSWSYEPRCYADQTRQYLPDFQVRHGKGSPVGEVSYVEVRPFVDEPVLVLTRMAVIWKSEPSAHLLLWVKDPLHHWSGRPWRQRLALWTEYDDVTRRRSDIPIFMDIANGTVVPIWADSI